MNQQLIDNPNIRITSLFYKALKNFRIQLAFITIYGIIKVITSLVLTSISITKSAPCQWELIDYWLLFVGLESISSIWCSLKSRTIMQDLVCNQIIIIKFTFQGHIVKIAEDLHQVIYIQEFNLIPQNEDELVVKEGNIKKINLKIKKNMIWRRQMFKRRIKKLVIQEVRQSMKQFKHYFLNIKKSLKKNTLLKWISFNTQIANQALIVLGFVIEFSNQDYDTTQQACKYAQLVFLFIYLIISVYQNIDLYVIVALVLICLPFIICFAIYYAIKQCQQKRKNNNFVEKLLKSQKKFIPGVIEGDQECRICLQTYNIDDEIIALPCNALHHFHFNCISAWLKVTPNCPLCRMNFGDSEELEQQLQQPLHLAPQNINQEL